MIDNGEHTTIAYGMCNGMGAMRIDSVGNVLWQTTVLTSPNTSTAEVFAHVTPQQIILMNNDYYGIVQGGQTLYTDFSPHIARLDCATGGITWDSIYYDQDSTTVGTGNAKMLSGAVCDVDPSKVSFVSCKIVGNQLYAFINGVDANTGQILWYDSTLMIVPRQAPLAFDDACNSNISYLRYFDTLYTAQYDATPGFLLANSTQSSNASFVLTSTHHAISIHAEPAQTFFLYSILGQKLGNIYTDANGCAIIHTSSLPAGLYILHSNYGKSSRFVIP
jgi:hypothetical protein